MATNQIHSPTPRLTRGGSDGWAEQIPLLKLRQKAVPAVIHSLHLHKIVSALGITEAMTPQNGSAPTRCWNYHIYQTRG